MSHELNEITSTTDGQHINLRSFNADDYIHINVEVSLSKLICNRASTSDEKDLKVQELFRSKEEELINSISEHGYDVSRGRIMVTHPQHINNGVAKSVEKEWLNIVNKFTDSSKTRSDGDENFCVYYILPDITWDFIIIDGNRRIIELRSTETVEKIVVSWVLRRDGQPLCLWERHVMAIHLNNVSRGIEVPSIKRHWLDIINSIVKFAPTFEKQYGISIFQATVTVVAKELRTLRLLQTDNIKSYWRYACVSRMLLRFPNVWNTILEEFYFSSCTSRLPLQLNRTLISVTEDAFFEYGKLID